MRKPPICFAVTGLGILILVLVVWLLVAVVVVTCSYHGHPFHESDPVAGEHHGAGLDLGSVLGPH